MVHSYVISALERGWEVGTSTYAEHHEGGSGGTRPPVRSVAEPSSGGPGVSPGSLLLDPTLTIQSTACPTPVGEAVNTATGKRFKIACNKWTCPECGPRKVWQLRKRYELGDLVPTAFLTLTQQTDDRSSITADWNRFVTSLRSKGWQVRYFWTKEFTRNGKSHLHVLVEGWWDWTQTSRLWLLATGGQSYITNIKKIRDPRQAVNYMLKYMTKTLESYYEKGERRYSCSRGVLLPPLHSLNPHHVYIYSAGKGYIGVGEARIRIEHYWTWVRAVIRDRIKTLKLTDAAFQEGQSLICS